MKKLFIMALCVASLTAANAQKAQVDAAKKLAGKTEKISEARSAINAAMQDPSTATDPHTYVVAADVEFKAYDAARKKLGLDISKATPEEKMAMDGFLLTAYPNLMKVIEFQANDPKGKAAGEAVKRMKNYVENYYQAGGSYYDNKKYYPEAYQAFMDFGDIVTNPMMKGQVNIPDSIAATSYYYAGLSGWAGNNLPKAIDAFVKARHAGFQDPDCYIRELASWQNLMREDSTITAKAQNAIYDLSKDGFSRFGLEQPIFISNMANVLVEQGKEKQAIDELTKLLQQYPNSGFIYGLRGYVNDRLENTDAAVADYRKAVENNPGYETMVNAAKNIYHAGITKWNNLDARNANVQQERENIRNNYFNFAQQIVDEAKKIAPNGDASALDYLQEQLDYAKTSLK